MEWSDRVGKTCWLGIGGLKTPSSLLQFPPFRTYLASDLSCILTVLHQSCLHPSCPAAVLSCIRPVQQQFCLASVLSFSCPVLHPTCPASVLSGILFVLHPFCTASVLSCIRLVLHPYCSLFSSCPVLHLTCPASSLTCIRRTADLKMNVVFTYTIFLPELCCHYSKYCENVFSLMQTIWNCFSLSRIKKNIFT